MAVTVIPTSNETVEVPGAPIILDAQYAREGDDLVLAVGDGDIIVIQGYFAQQSPPALTQQGSATMPGDLVVALADLDSSLAGQGVGMPIGRVTYVDGVATSVLPGGIEVRLLPRDAVFQDSLIETDASGAVGIVLADDTTVTLSSNGRLLLDEFVYNPASNLGTSALTIIRGVLSTTTGRIGEAAPENVSVRTLVGTIGIRGTTFVVQVDDVGAVEVTVVEGVIFVTLPDGCLLYTSPSPRDGLLSRMPSSA